VLALQEFFSTPWLFQLDRRRAFEIRLRALGYNKPVVSRPGISRYVGLGQRSDGSIKFTDSGLMIFSRLRIVAEADHYFTSSVAHDRFAMKGALWARLELAPGKYLDVVNCHLQAVHTRAGFHSTLQVQREQLRSLRRFIAQRCRGQPYLLTGDFNRDAIEPHGSDSIGAFGYSFRRTSEARPFSADLPGANETDDQIERGPESAEYRDMMTILDPNGELADLLFESQGLPGPPRQHPCTRPPRRSIPRGNSFKSISYRAVVHKHPMRLDYVFFRQTRGSFLEHSKSTVQQFKHPDEPFQYLSDHFGIESHFSLRCAFTWRHPPPHVDDSAGLTLTAIASFTKLLKGAGHVCLAPFSIADRLFHRYFTVRGAIVAFAAFAASIVAFLPFEAHVAFRSVVGIFAIAMHILFVDIAKRMRATSRMKQLDDEREEDEESDSEADVQPPPHLDPGVIDPYASFHRSARRHYDSPCLGIRSHLPDGTRGPYEWLTYGEVHRRVLHLSSGLRRRFAMTLRSRVGFLGDSCAEWVICELALVHCGVHTICLLDTQDAVDTDMDVLVCSTEWLAHAIDGGTRITELAPSCITFTEAPADLRAKLTPDEDAALFDVPYLTSVGRVQGLIPQMMGLAAWATFTTMKRWSHHADAQVRNVEISLQLLTNKAYELATAPKIMLGPSDVHFSYNSPAYIGEKVLLHATLMVGGAIGFRSGWYSAGATRVFFEDVRHLRPTFFAGTPHMFEGQFRAFSEINLGVFGSLFWRFQEARLDRNPDKPSTAYDRWSGVEKIRRVAFGKARPRFLLVMCTSSAAGMQPKYCRWLRTFFMSPVLKALVTTKGAGFITLGEARYDSQDLTERATLVNHFYVGRPLGSGLVTTIDTAEALEWAGKVQEMTRGRPLGHLRLSGPGIIHHEKGPPEIPDMMTPGIQAGSANPSRAGAPPRGGPWGDEGAPVRVGEADTESKVKRISSGVWKHTAHFGIIACDDDDGNIYCVGDMSSTENLGLHKDGGGCVPLGALEQMCVMAHGTHAKQPWLAQLFLTSEPTAKEDHRNSHKLVAVATVHLESLWRIARDEGLLGQRLADSKVGGDEMHHADSRTHITNFVYEQRVVDWCLQMLRRTVRTLAAPVTVSRMVIHPHPFCPENGFQTPTFRLRRGRIRRAFVSRRPKNE